MTDTPWKVDYDYPAMKRPVHVDLLVGVRDAKGELVLCVPLSVAERIVAAINRPDLTAERDQLMLDLATVRLERDTLQEERDNATARAKESRR